MFLCPRLNFKSPASSQPPTSKIYPHPHLIYHFHSQAGSGLPSNVDLVGEGKGGPEPCDPGLGNRIYLWTMTTVIIANNNDIYNNNTNGQCCICTFMGQRPQKCLPISWEAAQCWLNSLPLDLDCLGSMWLPTFWLGNSSMPACF